MRSLAGLALLAAGAACAQAPIVSPGRPPEPGTDVRFVECSDCDAAQAAEAARAQGEGVRYVFDLRDATIAKFRVSGKSHGRRRMADGTFLSVWWPGEAHEVTPVEREAADVARSLASAGLVAAGIERQALAFSVPIAEMGSNPGSMEPYAPWAVAFFNGNYGAWASLARSYLFGPTFKARFPQAEALIAGCSQAAGIAYAAREYEPGQLWACGRLALQSQEALWRLRLEAADGDYVLIEMTADGRVRYAGAFDALGTQYRDSILATEGKAHPSAPVR